MAARVADTLPGRYDSMKYNRSLCLTVALAVPAIGLLLAAGCSTNSSKPASPPPVAPEASVTAVTPFVGNEACAECHAAEFRAHKDSFHAKTARLVQDVGPIVLPKGEILGSKCTLQRDGDGIQVSVGGAVIGAVSLQYG